jgi:hypothetical protein
MMHCGVTADGDIDYFIEARRDDITQIARKGFDPGHYGCLQLAASILCANRVIDARDEVGTKRHLGVLDTLAGQAHAGFKINKESCRIRGTKINGKPKCALSGRAKPN